MGGIKKHQVNLLALCSVDEWLKGLLLEGLLFFDVEFIWNLSDLSPRTADLI